MKYEKLKNVIMLDKEVEEEQSLSSEAIRFWHTKRWIYNACISERKDETYEWWLRCANIRVADMENVPSLEVAVEELNKTARVFHAESLWFVES